MLLDEFIHSLNNWKEHFKYNKDKDDFLKPINDNRALNSVDKVGVKWNKMALFMLVILLNQMVIIVVLKKMNHMDI
jgi:hypothetical protein